MTTIRNEKKHAAAGRHTRIATLLWAGLLAASSAGAQEAFTTTADGHLAAADRLIVRFKDDASTAGIASAHRGAGAYDAETLGAERELQVVTLGDDTDVETAMAEYAARPDVEYVEPDYVITASGVPNDPSFGQLWGLRNTGQTGGVAGADIDAAAAWDMTTGSSGVAVMVIDTGIDYGHPDLAPNMYRNTADCDGDGVDDDGNGWRDDCYGIDTVNNDGNPMDDDNHGTHVAGTIGAAGNNGVGVVGVNHQVKLIACKFLDANGSGYTSNAVRCLQYAATMKDRGVPIVTTSNSWGGRGYSQSLADAIESNRTRGILFIAAAGNDATNNDAEPTYPASYTHANIIAVASTTHTDAMSSFSSYGASSVDLGAPGSAIFSTLPGNRYGTMSGTSMATPHVAGVVALVKAYKPALSWSAIKAAVLDGGDRISALSGRTVTGRRLNAYGALSCASPVLARQLPASTTIGGGIGTPVQLAVRHVRCGVPGGNVTVSVAPEGTVVTLRDDGSAGDATAGDGVYSAQWTPTSAGVRTLGFPDNSTVIVDVGSACATITDPRAKITMKPGRELGTVDAGFDLAMTAYNGEPVTIELLDRDGTLAVEHIATLPPKGRGGRWLYREGVIFKLNLRDMTKRRPGQFAFDLKTRPWFVNADATDPADYTTLRLRFGTKCFEHVVTRKY